jgi:hypothetical protein
LPRAIDVVTARCPLCQTDFDVAGQAETPRPPPRPSAVSRANTPRAPEPSPFDFEREPDPLDREDRQAIAWAATWLRAAGLIGLAHSLVCWCGTFAYLGPHEHAAVGYCVGYVFNILVSLVVHNGARALTARRDRVRAWLAAYAAVLAAILEALFAAPTLLAFLHVATGLRRRLPGEDNLMIFLILVLHLVLVILYLTAGIKTMLALQRPGVRRAMSR